MCKRRKSSSSCTFFENFIYNFPSVSIIKRMNIKSQINLIIFLINWSLDSSCLLVLGFLGPCSMFHGHQVHGAWFLGSSVPRFLNFLGHRVLGSLDLLVLCFSALEVVSLGPQIIKSLFPQALSPLPWSLDPLGSLVLRFPSPRVFLGSSDLWASSPLVF